MSAQGSGSFEEEEPFVSPRDAEMLHIYKAAMSKLAKSSSSADNFSSLTSRLKTSWENTTELDPRKARQKLFKGVFSFVIIIIIFIEGAQLAKAVFSGALMH